jgi:ectoine hydroxylase-related dioxygenase (phytanoyl-CoA dioxygenase family)
MSDSLNDIRPALKFSNHSVHPNDEGNVLLQFRERGYAVLENVFQRDSVDAFREQILSASRKNDAFMTPYILPEDNPLFVFPAKAPRLRHVLSGAFAWGRVRPMVCLGHPSWLIKPSNPDARQVHDWHKDGDHESLGTLSGGYQYPNWVHVNMYFEDMTPEQGPTYVIPRSHRDGKLSPFAGAPEAPLLCKKGDVVLWDQRMWHRGSARTAEGLRVVAIFGFFSVPRSAGEGLIKAVPSQVQAWKQAETADERCLFGGPFRLGE